MQKLVPDMARQLAITEQGCNPSTYVVEHLGSEVFIQPSHVLQRFAKFQLPYLTPCSSVARDRMPSVFVAKQHQSGCFQCRRSWQNVG